MKALCVPIAALMLVCQAMAEVKIPAGVFRIGQMEEAVEQAREQKKPLAIIGFDETVEKKDFAETNEDALKSVSGYATVVFISLAKEANNTESRQLSPPLMKEFHGINTLPVILIASPAEDDVWISVHGRELHPDKRKKVLRETEAAAKIKSTAYYGSKTPVPPVLPGDKILEWGVPEGKRAYEGRFVRLGSEHVHVVASTGKAGAIPFKELNAAAVRYAKWIAGGAAAEKPGDKPGAKPEEKPVAGPVERRTNKDGKDLQAAFVRLVDGKLTLKSAEGKEYTLPLTALSLTSQVRAKELAAKTAKP